MVQEKKVSETNASAAEDLLELVFEESSDIFSKEGLLQNIEDGLLVADFPRAEKLLDDFKLQFGEIPEFFYKKSQFFRRKNDFTQCYQYLKLIYFDFPLFFRDKNDYQVIRDSFLQEKVEKAKVHWNVLINLSTKLIATENLPTGNVLDQQNMLREKINDTLDQVIESYKDVLRTEPMHIQALKGLIYCFTEYGDLDEAGVYREKLDTAQKHWGNLINKRSQVTLVEGRKTLREGDFEEAIAIVNLGLVTSPFHRDLLMLKAEALKELKKFREASKCIDVVLKKYPSEPGAIRVKKEIQNGRLEETLHLGLVKLNETEQMLPGTEMAKTIRSSQDCFFEVLEIDPENLKALLGIYRGQLLTGNPIKAKKTLQKIREIDPTLQVEKKLPSTPVIDLDEDPCFIAGRIFGRTSHEVFLLRQFRDTFLKLHFPGIVSVTLYRRIGPALANLPGKGPLYPLIRTGLRLFCKSLSYTLSTNSLGN